MTTFQQAFESAVAYYNGGRHSEGIEVLEQFADEVRLNHSASILVGYCCSGAERWKEAAEHLQRALTLLPQGFPSDQRAELAHNASAAAYRAGNLELSVVLLSRAIESGPPNAAYLSTRAFLYGQLAQYSKSVADYRMVRALAPDNIEIGNAMIFMLLRIGRVADVCELLGEYATVCSPDAAPHFLRRQRFYSWINDQLGIARTLGSEWAQAGRRGLVMSTAVWGDAYIDFLNDYFLKSQLAGRNAPLVSQSRDVFHAIVTTRSSADRLRSKRVFRLAEQTIKFVFFEMPDELFAEISLSTDTVQRWCAMWYVAIEFAKAAGASVSICSPDTIWYNGALKFLADAEDAGYEAVLGGATNADRRTFPDFLRENGAMHDDYIDVTHEQLVEATATNSADLWNRLAVSEKNSNFLTYECIGWSTPNERIFHAYHHHPLLISGKRLQHCNEYDMGTNLDTSHFVGRMFPDPADYAKILVPEDNRYIAAVEINPVDRSYPPASNRKFNLQEAVGYCRASASDPICLWLFEKRITQTHNRQLTENDVFLDTYDPEIVRKILEK